jgi:hypothetical protein
VDDRKGWRLIALTILDSRFSIAEREAEVREQEAVARMEQEGAKRERQERTGSGAVTRVVLAAKGGIHGPQQECRAQAGPALHRAASDHVFRATARRHRQC